LCLITALILSDYCGEDAFMIHLTLNDHDRQQLEPPFKTTADRRLRDRC
jgi:hypothetical protein